MLFCLHFQGVSHSKVAKGESSKVNSVASSGNLGVPSASSHNSLDGTHNGFNSHDGGHLQNELDAKASHSKSRLDKDKEKEREKRKEYSLDEVYGQGNNRQSFCTVLRYH